MSNIWYREEVSDAEWAAHAEECRQEARRIEEDKHRILDDDGYAFYHNGMMDKAFREAQLADDKGIGWVLGLADMNGNVVDAKVVDGKFGKVFCVKKDDGSVEWVNVSQAQNPKREQAFYESKGYQLVYVYYHFAVKNYDFYPIKERGIVDVEFVHKEEAVA